MNIQVVTWDEYWTLLEAGATGGSLPDVFWMHSNSAQMYMENDMLLDLTKYIKKSDVVKMENYYQGISELYSYKGKQYAMPKEEAANIDGCSIFQRFLLIMAPLTRSAMVSLSIFTAVFAFKDLMWPMIVCSNATSTTLSAGLAKMQGQYASNFPELMAAALMACLPMIIIYLIFQKQFIEGIATSGGKL